MRSRKLDGGFAQILVIAALAVLSAVLTVAITTAHLSSRQITALDKRVVAEIRLDSGLTLLRDALADPANDLEVRALAGPVTVQLGNQPIELAMAGEGGKIDVMRGDLELVEHFVLNAGLDRSQATTLLSALTNSRRIGDDFGALQDIQLALADAIGFDAVDDSFTRFGSDKIDPAMAGEPVLRAIPDLNPGEAMQILAAPAAERGQFSSLSRYFATGSRRFMIVARETESGHYSRRRLPIELTASGGIIELDSAR